ncbi:MAG TPA: dUTP diphosphatase, partial [Acidobacteriota bacterium]|nr:dUTP diphosphatase [Acidobacteriota bacterium]
MVVVKLKRLHPDARVPEYKSENAAGADLHACIAAELVVPPSGIVLVRTGIAIEVPPGYQGEIRSRSGLALNEGLFVLNSPGTIDADYRGELKIILGNFSQQPRTIHPFDRIAQLVIMPAFRAHFSEADLS